MVCTTRRAAGYRAEGHGVGGLVFVAIGRDRLGLPQPDRPGASSRRIPEGDRPQVLLGERGLRELAGELGDEAFSFGEAASQVGVGDAGRARDEARDQSRCESSSMSMSYLAFWLVHAPSTFGE